jgi:hypothetical protein
MTKAAGGLLIGSALVRASASLACHVLGTSGVMLRTEPFVALRQHLDQRARRCVCQTPVSRAAHLEVAAQVLLPSLSWRALLIGRPDIHCCQSAFGKSGKERAA